MPPVGTDPTQDPVLETGALPVSYEGMSNQIVTSFARKYRTTIKIVLILRGEHREQDRLIRRAELSLPRRPATGEGL